MILTPFNYHLVGQPLIDELQHQVERGNSLLLIAPRFGGKRHVLNRLRERLEKANSVPIVEARLLSEKPLSTVADLRKKILDAVRPFTINSDFSLPNLDSLQIANEAEESNEPENPEDLLKPLRLLAEHVEKPIYFFAANVDGMSHYLARGFLQCVRNLAAQRKVVAVLTGEDDFQKLIHGDTPVCDGARQYVLQGYDQDEFNRFIDDYLRYLRLTFEPPDKLYKHIWELTGGNIYLLRMVLWTIIQNRSRVDRDPTEPVTVNELPDEVKMVAVPGVYGAYIFRHATHIIENDANCWTQLSEFIANRTVNVGPGLGPTTLELAGVAVRQVGERNVLKPASALMSRFVSEYFDDRRLGDLYGLKHSWDEAFSYYDSYYENLEDEARMRPLGPEDKRATENLISALDSTLHFKATKIAEHEAPTEVAIELQKLFVKGCYHLLGYKEVSFWTRSSSDPRRWQHRELSDIVKRIPKIGISTNAGRKIQASLQMTSFSGLVSESSIFPLQGEASNFAIATYLPSIDHSEQVVVVVSDFDSVTGIEEEPERAKHVRSLMNSFSKAYSHALYIAQQQHRERTRRVHREIFQRVLTEIFFWRQLAVNELLLVAAHDLQSKLAYKRVLFSLVDREKTRIEGIAEVIEPGMVELKKETNWPLNDPGSHLQSLVIQTKKFEIVSNAATIHIGNPKNFTSAHVRAFGLLPLLDDEKTAIGTLMIEPADDAPPSKTEMEDLQHFSGQLAIAIEYAKRVKILESCLNGIPEPLFIFDKDGKEQYQNRAAAQLSEGEIGWLRNKTNPRTTAIETVRQFASETLHLGHRLARVLEVSDGAGSMAQYKGGAVADVVKDSREEAVGALVRIQDQTYLDKYFRAERLVNKGDDPDTAISQILEAMTQIGHKWARLYRLRFEGETERFVSELSRGHAKREFEIEFNEHRVKLYPFDIAPYEWECMKGDPVVFCWKPGYKRGEIYYTPFGLPAINWPHPEQPPQIAKKEGDFWVDFPLISEGEQLGKICLQCNENFQPEHFLLLKNLSSSFADILSTSIRRQQAGKEYEDTIKLSVAIKVIGTVAHSLGTKHGSLSHLLGLYRDLEGTYPDLIELNDEFQIIQKQIAQIVSRARDLFRSVPVNFKPGNLVLEIQRGLASAAQENFLHFEFKGSYDQFVIPLDSPLLVMALNELVANSREAIKDEKQLAIRINVEVSSPSENYVTLIYEDNGPGIPPEFVRRVFDVEDAFSHKPYRSERGTGLGMSFVIRTIKGHGGSIEYVGEQGSGAKFMIKLPGTKGVS